MATTELFIRLPAVLQKEAMSKSQIYKLIAQDQFPIPVKVSRRISCWVTLEIDDWIEKR